MDCQTFRSLTQPGLINEGLKKAFSEEIERHLQTCAACRKRYTSQKESTDESDRIFLGATKTKTATPSGDDPLNPFTDLSDPIEFKDAALTFTLVLDSREEEIKIVEPEVDFPLPKDGRLVVRENETRLTDVVFRFHPAKVRSYELHFRVKEGIFYAEPHVLTYGKPGVGDKWINDVYLERVVARGGVNAWIKMRRGSARIYIQYISPLPEDQF